MKDFFDVILESSATDTSDVNKRHYSKAKTAINEGVWAGINQTDLVKFFNGCRKLPQWKASEFFQHLDKARVESLFDDIGIDALSQFQRCLGQVNIKAPSIDKLPSAVSTWLFEILEANADNRDLLVDGTAFQPEFEFEDAKRFCAQHEIPLKILHGSVLKDNTTIENPKNRCYYCKQRIFSAIQKEALAQGFPVLLDGTNASDEADDRPGMLALKELHVLSPLRLCGLTKQDIRMRSKEAGLFTWDKPSYACLATRIPTGMKITGELLHAIESCENILFSMGFSDFRVRVRDGYALLQVTESDYPKASASLDHIQQAFAAYFPKVVLDTQVR